MSDTWTTPEDDPRTYGNPVGEMATYREYLRDYRLTMEMKCDGLDAVQLARRSIPPSTLSLLGLVRHLAQVENHWFQRVLQRRTSAARLYKAADDPDWDFTGATADPAVVKDAFAVWKAEIDRRTYRPVNRRRAGPASGRPGLHHAEIPFGIQTE